MKKKDPNYIAAVEKAIVEKYGKNAVQDFRHEWDEKKETEYLKQLRRKTVKFDQSKTKSRNVPDRNCPVCKTYSFSGRDDLYMNRFKCCRECYVEYIASSPTHEQEWQSGWRPSEDEVEYRMSIRRQK
jgi:hypothetical protein